ncbi:MAG TPA: hypothetical protein VMF59_15060, partial [Bacteroidota bacterium]|nr:hypothetical protein [Bacteroidota bacterium]
MRLLTPACVLLLVNLAAGQDPITRQFSGLYGQVEVGGPYAGAEFHDSRPLPSRISLYEPAANSIDMSRDYWKRGESAPFIVGVRTNGGAPLHVGLGPWPYTLSPHRVRFQKDTAGLGWTSSFEFFGTSQGLLWTLTCENKTGAPLDVEVYAQCRTVLRTCQTYAWLDSAWTEHDASRGAIAVHFDQPESRMATLVLQNLGDAPRAWTSSADELGADPLNPAWFTSHAGPAGRTLSHDHQGRPVAAFTYGKHLAPRGLITIRIGIFSAELDQWKSAASALRRDWEKDVAAYDGLVRSQLRHAPHTGDASIDRSAQWACALLAVNAHSLGGRIVPMPCPAEYNFFFTHDVLLTDLAAVWFDVPRVKRDLETIAGWAEHGIIPHARYWRDDAFKTELCTPDNWNHLWFIEAVTRYLHHTADTATVARLYPLVKTSLEQILTQCHADSLMYAFRPDWWDIGRREGPRSYITILTIRALRDYLYICSSMRRELSLLPSYELLADGMERALNARLWDRSAGYLMNANGADPDRHFYMGSLLGAVYGVIPRERALTLLETARRVLVDERIGVRNVMPPDFHTDSVRAYFRFPTNEAGDPYFYANGGVWPHANAWYAQGLVASGRTDEALSFFRNVMTLDGISASPRGQPAFYEYRYADTSSERYGAVDKPSFLWAGGFYLGTLYALEGFRETEWNIGIGGQPGVFQDASAQAEFGGSKQIRIRGRNGDGAALSIGGVLSPSGIFPLDRMTYREWNVGRDEPSAARLTDINAILRECRTEGRGGLRAVISSFDGHRVVARIAGGSSAPRATVDGKT